MAEVRRTLPHARAAVIGVAVLLAACAGGDPAPGPEATVVDAPEWPHWDYDASMVFPADQSLLRAEDGVALAGGRLLVVDQAAGVRLVEADGSSAPFGDLPGAGYRHDPPEHSGGANGIALEPDGAHALVADIHHGGIYRVDVTTGATELLHQHGYGVNTAVRDSRGAVWFTQSANNTPEDGGARMWAAVDGALAEGVLYRLPMEDGHLAAEPEPVVEGLQFGNGIAIDEAAGFLYVAETMAGRVLRYRLDLDTGELSDRAVVLDGVMPDNLELDDAGRLWIAAPLINAVVVIDTVTGEHRTVFEVQTPAQRDNAAEFFRRVEAGEPCLELFTPDTWAPLPGAVTGVILSPDDGPVYVSGLGNALIRLPRGD